MGKCLRVVKGFAIASLMAVTMTGCMSMGRSPMMHDLETVAKPKADTAVVHFLRPTKYGYGIKFGIWDSEKFVGILEAVRHIPYETEPGEHIFLAQAENWSVVRATLKPGNNYFILGRVYPGFWKARVGCDPVCKEDKISQEQIDDWMTRLIPRGMDPAMSEAYAKPRLKQVRKILKRVESGKIKPKVMTAEDYR